MTTRKGIRYQPLPLLDSDLMEETMSQSSQKPSFQLPHLPDDIIPYHKPFPPPPPSLPIKRGPIKQPVERKWISIRDSLYDPSDQESVWFSCAELYTKIQALSSNGELEFSQTHPIIELWSSVRDSKFAGEMDALLPNPNIKEQIYVFCGNSTVKIDTTSRTVDVKKPRRIIDQWQSLKAAGFTRIDAVLPDPENKNRVWFFKGRHFVSVWWEPGVANDYLLDNPKLITEGWKSLKAAGFENVTMIVPNAKSPDEPWVFSGFKYMRISISADTILFGPALVPDV